MQQRPWLKHIQARLSIRVVTLLVLGLLLSLSSLFLQTLALLFINGSLILLLLFEGLSLSLEFGILHLKIILVILVVVLVSVPCRTSCNIQILLIGILLGDSQIPSESFSGQTGLHALQIVEDQVWRCGSGA